MYFRITIPSLQDGKKDEAISFVKDKVMPEFDGTPGLLTMMAAITGETSGINMSAYESKESAEAVEEKIQGVLSEAAGMMAAPPVIYQGDAVFGKVYQTMPAGIGEHSDITEAVIEELNKLAAADERLEMINKYFSKE